MSVGSLIFLQIHLSQTTPNEPLSYKLYPRTHESQATVLTQQSPHRQSPSSFLLLLTSILVTAVLVTAVLVTAALISVDAAAAALAPCAATSFLECNS